MNKLPEKQVKELRTSLETSFNIAEYLLETVRCHRDKQEEVGHCTDRIRETFNDLYELKDDLGNILDDLSELRHADLTPYSPPPLSRPD